MRVPSRQEPGEPAPGGQGSAPWHQQDIKAVRRGTAKTGRPSACGQCFDVLVVPRLTALASRNLGTARTLAVALPYPKALAHIDVRAVP